MSRVCDVCGPHFLRDIEKASRHAARVRACEDDLSLYRSNTRAAKHYFCRQSGIDPFHRMRKDLLLRRFNIGCVERIAPYTLEASVAKEASLSVVEDA